MTLNRVVTSLGLTIGIAALVTQFGIVMTRNLMAGGDLVAATVRFFSFFTILSNLALVLIYLSDLRSARWLAPFRHPVTRGMLAAAMLLVMLFYHILLAHLWSPQGLARATDIALHYLGPLVYVSWWLALRPHGTLAWRDIPLMLLPTFVYFLYMMARGAIIARYPYPLFAANELGYGQVLINALLVGIGLAVLSAIVIGVDKFLARTQTQTTRDLA